jgi:hypothetical protein
MLVGTLNYLDYLNCQLNNWMHIISCDELLELIQLDHALFNCPSRNRENLDFIQGRSIINGVYLRYLSEPRVLQLVQGSHVLGYWDTNIENWTEEFFTEFRHVMHHPRSAGIY